MVVKKNLKGGEYVNMFDDYFIPFREEEIHPNRFLSSRRMPLQNSEKHVGDHFISERIVRMP